MGIADQQVLLLLTNLAVSGGDHKVVHYSAICGYDFTEIMVQYIEMAASVTGEGNAELLGLGMAM